MKLVARKKIVFVIVEGPSDEQALGIILNKIYDKNVVYVHIAYRDITTEFIKSKNKNVFTLIADEVKGFAKSHHYTSKDFKEIIHIVDTDGAFIPNECVVEDHSAKDPVYSLYEIRTYNKKGIEERNKQKSNNINKLYNRKIIYNLPYRVFYMSCNLDHVLYNKLNSSDEEKENDSFAFAKKYRNKIADFIKFISESDFSVNKDYKESWEFIKQDLHSLQRHTNLGILFEKIETSI